MCLFLYLCTGTSFSVILFACQQHNFLLSIPVVIHYNYVWFYFIIFLFYSLGLDKMKEMILNSVQLVSIIIALLFI